MPNATLAEDFPVTGAQTAIRLMTDKELLEHFYRVRNFLDTEQDPWLKKYAKEVLGFVQDEAYKRIRAEEEEVFGYDPGGHR